MSNAPAHRPRLARFASTSAARIADHTARSGTAEAMAEFYEAAPVADHLGWDDWVAQGAKDADARAAGVADGMTAEPLPLPEDRTEALDDFITRRTRELGG